MLDQLASAEGKELPSLWKLSNDLHKKDLPVVPADDIDIGQALAFLGDRYDE